MRKLFLSLFLLLGGAALGPGATAQTVFAPSGAHWWLRGSFMSGTSLLHRYAMGDTLLNGQVCQKVYTEEWLGMVVGPGPLRWVYGGRSNQPSLFFYVQGDRVYRQFPDPQRPAELIVDYGLPAGSNWLVRPRCSDDTLSAIRVDSVTLTTAYGQSLRVQHQSGSSASGGPSWHYMPYQQNPAIERLGFLRSWLKPSPECSTDPDYYELLHYTDGVVTFGTQPVIPLAVPAERTVTHRPVPNPAADGRFTFPDLAVSLPYTVADALGRGVAAGQLSPGNARLDLSALPAGVYLLRTGGPRPATHRLLIGSR